MADFSQRFSQLWSRCAGGKPVDPAIWNTIATRYGESHRHYHDLGHLQQCLRELDAAGDTIAERDATEMAIWFHDIIYVYAAKDNEERSADTFRNYANGGMNDGFVDRVYDFILATKHTGSAPDQGTAYLVDIDLSGFGLPWEGYLADSDALRLEAPDVPDEKYYAGKLRFLEGLLEWPSLFQTDYFRDRLEAQAKRNITRYTTQLREQGYEA